MLIVGRKCRQESKRARINTARVLLLPTIAQFTDSDVSIAFLVKDLEAIDKVLLGASSLESIGSCQDLQEGFKVDDLGVYSNGFKRTCQSHAHSPPMSDRKRERE